MVYLRQPVDEAQHTSLDAPNGDKHGLLQWDDNDAAYDAIMNISGISQDRSCLLIWEKVGGKVSRGIDQNEHESICALLTVTRQSGGHAKKWQRILTNAPTMTPSSQRNC